MTAIALAARSGIGSARWRAEKGCVKELVETENPCDQSLTKSCWPTSHTRAYWNWCGLMMPDQKAGTLTLNVVEVRLGNRGLELLQVSCHVLPQLSWTITHKPCHNVILWVANGPEGRVLWFNRPGRRICRWLVERILRHVCSDGGVIQENSWLNNDSPLSRLRYHTYHSPMLNPLALYSIAKDASLAACLLTGIARLYPNCGGIGLVDPLCFNLYRWISRCRCRSGGSTCSWLLGWHTGRLLWLNWRLARCEAWWCFSCHECTHAIRMCFRNSCFICWHCVTIACVTWNWQSGGSRPIARNVDSTTWRLSYSWSKSVFAIDWDQLALAFHLCWVSVDTLKAMRATPAKLTLNSNA